MKVTTVIVHWINRILALVPLRIMNTGDSVEFLLNNNCSLSRYGDGELMIMLGGDIIFQKYNPVLSNRLKEILSLGEMPGFRVGIPYALKSTVGGKQYYIDFWQENLKTGRMHWLRLINIRKTYLDACFTWCLTDKENPKPMIPVFENLMKLWENKNILIVEGINGRLGVGNGLFITAKARRRILCPSENAFDLYDQILSEIKRLRDPDEIVLISLGPTATVLAYDLYRSGVRTIDLGHINKEYKLMLDLLNKTDDVIISEREYESEVICRILKNETI